MHCPFRKHWLNELCRSSKYGHMWSYNIEELYSIVSPSSSVKIGKLSSSWWLLNVFPNLIFYWKLKFHCWQLTSFPVYLIWQVHFVHFQEYSRIMSVIQIKKWAVQLTTQTLFLMTTIVLPQWVGVLMYTSHFNMGNIKNMYRKVKM